MRKIIWNLFFGFFWLENYIWFGECFILFSLIYRKKRLCVKFFLKNILNVWLKDIWKKCIYIFKLNIKWYFICIEIGVNFLKIFIYFYIMYIYKWWVLSYNKCLWIYLFLEFLIVKNLRNYIFFLSFWGIWLCINMFIL